MLIRSNAVIWPQCILLLFSLWVCSVAAAPDFPKLTGRVVDQAGLLTAEQVSTISTRLAQLEDASSNQIVVVTVKDLQGYAIAQYGVELGRFWGIGQKGKDNGALLIIAPAEKKIRIEVGYGLEGYLTDIVSHSIIQNEIRPAFRAGDFSSGISNGVNAMISAIDGSYIADVSSSNRRSASDPKGFFPLVFIAIIALSQFLKQRGAQGIAGGVAFGGVAGLMVTVITQTILYGVLAAIAVFALSALMSGGGGGKGTPTRRPEVEGMGGGYFGGGGFGGGGFSGGGGGFGGGGASGGW